VKNKKVIIKKKKIVEGYHRSPLSRRHKPWWVCFVPIQPFLAFTVCVNVGWNNCNSCRGEGGGRKPLLL